MIGFLISDTSQDPWRYVGQWIIPGIIVDGQTGTGQARGVLLGQDYVLTAAHVARYFDTDSTFTPQAYYSNGAMQAPAGTLTAAHSTASLFGDLFSRDSAGVDIAAAKVVGTTNIATAG